MSKQHIISVTLSVLIGMGILFIAAGSSMAMQDNEQLLKKLQGLDRMQRLTDVSARNMDAGYMATFNMTIPHPLGPAQGKEFMHCTIVWSGDSCAIDIQSEYEHPPVYQPIGTGGENMDYDSDGNLCVWRSERKSILSTKSRNEAVENLKQYTIRKDGVILRVDSYTQKYVYKVGDEENTYVFDQFRLATGLGIVQHLREIDTATPEFIAARGDYGSSLRGSWRFSHDRAVDQICREGIFMVEGEPNPVVQFRNRGVVGSSMIKAARSATLQIGRYEAGFEVLNLDSKADVERGDVFKRVLHRLDTGLIPEISEVIDYRTEKPTRTPVVR